MGHTLCSPVYIQGTNSVGTLFNPYIYTGDKQCGAHSSSPIYIQGTNSVGHTLHPLYIYRGQTVWGTLFVLLYIYREVKSGNSMLCIWYELGTKGVP